MLPLAATWIDFPQQLAVIGIGIVVSVTILVILRDFIKTLFKAGMWPAMLVLGVGALLVYGVSQFLNLPGGANRAVSEIKKAPTTVESKLPVGQ